MLAGMIRRFTRNSLMSKFELLDSESTAASGSYCIWRLDTSNIAVFREIEVPVIGSTLAMDFFPM
jgi:hypothetical protein